MCVSVCGSVSVSECVCVCESVDLLQLRSIPVTWNRARVVGVLKSALGLRECGRGERMERRMVGR